MERGALRGLQYRPPLAQPSEGHEVKIVSRALSGGVLQSRDRARPFVRCPGFSLLSGALTLSTPTSRMTGFEAESRNRSPQSTNVPPV